IPNNYIALRKIWRYLPARVCALILILLYLVAGLADFFAPYSMNFADPDLANAPPTKIHFFVESNSISAPFVYQSKREFDPDTYKQIYNEQNQTPLPLQFFVKGESYKLFGLIPCRTHLFGVSLPAHIFIFGSDINGRDNFSRLFFGAQKSLTIGFLGLL